jgi:hypothetical protein
MRGGYEELTLSGKCPAGDAVADITEARVLV